MIANEQRHDSCFKPGVKLCAAVIALLMTPALAPAQFGVLDPSMVGKPAEPVTASERAQWAIVSTVGPASLLGGLFSAGWGTLFNDSHEYGPHWAGFGDRYGMRLTGVATSNGMEAALGSLWREDPRYWRKGDGFPLKQRIGHVFKYTFLALDADGNARPAYARYVAYAGNNFLSNTWREPSESDAGHAISRTALAFLGRIASNSWDEFWPDVKRRAFHRASSADIH